MGEKADNPPHTPVPTSSDEAVKYESDVKIILQLLPVIALRVTQFRLHEHATLTKMESMYFRQN